MNDSQDSVLGQAPGQKPLQVWRKVSAEPAGGHRKSCLYTDYAMETGPEAGD